MTSNCKTSNNSNLVDSISKQYNFRDIEARRKDTIAKQFHTQDNSSRSDNRVENCYVLEMLPYPSGRIHVGHVRNYTIGDVFARYKMSRGFNVLHPMGWDAFGLPAENAAIKNNIHPDIWTKQNIESMKEDLIRLGFSYDWSVEFATCDPSYYKHTQKLFLELYKKGLVYLDNAVVNWDPVENTVLANEQVIDGKGWRSGAVIERREMPHWFIRITDYAQDLLDGLDNIDWPESVKVMQRNWIGKSIGANFKFEVFESSNDNEANKINEVRVFSTMPHTLFGGIFLVIAPEHELVERFLNNADIKAFVEHMKMRTVEEKREPKFEGIQLPGIYAINPYTKKQMPIFIADYVLADYGTGAVFACPAHDDRDNAFAKKYGLEIIEVMQGESGSEIMINSGFLNGLEERKAFEIMIADMESKGIGQQETNYKLRDWSVSRQRYWGCPIPIIHCDKCGTLPVDVDNLPVELPKDVDFAVPGNPLERHPTWKHTTCHKCGGPALRETETMDTFIDSSWYFLRYAYLVEEKNKGQERKGNGTEDAFSARTVEQWFPVDMYIGGIEHAVMHLLYARFFMKALNPSGDRSIEPFRRLFNQGMVCSATYHLKDSPRLEYVYPEDVSLVNGKYQNREGQEVIQGSPVKMSKSLKNDVNLRNLMDAYGSDTIRLAVLSDSPPEQSLIWTQDNVAGCWKFLQRIWNLGVHILSSEHTCEASNDTTVLLHQSIKGITQDIENMQYNTYIAKLRILFNALEDAAKKGEKICDSFNIFLKLANPLMPYITQELYELFNDGKCVVSATWPQYDENMIEAKDKTFAIQVNGKLKSTIKLSVDMNEEQVISAAREQINALLDGKEIKRVITVLDRGLVNFIVA